MAPFKFHLPGFSRHSDATPQQSTDARFDYTNDTPTSHTEVHAWVHTGPADQSSPSQSYNPSYTQNSFSPQPQAGISPIAPTGLEQWPGDGFSQTQSFGSPYATGFSDPMYGGWPGGSAFPSNTFPGNAFPSNDFPSNAFPGNGMPPPTQQSKFGKFTKGAGALASAAPAAIGFVDDKFGGFGGLENAAESTFDNGFNAVGSALDQEFTGMKQDIGVFGQDVDGVADVFAEEVADVVDPFAVSGAGGDPFDVMGQSQDMVRY